MKRAIKIVGARTHNLKGIDCQIPARKITVVTGVSGSGKSSLVFDTLYAEGQRRYVQSLSTYARLFLEQMQRPDVDSISDIPPALALEQKNAIKNARSTVGTITEVHDYLRLLMVHAGTVHCLDCDGVVAAESVSSVTDHLLKEMAGRRVAVHARVQLHGMEPAEALQTLIKQGYNRILVGGQAVALEEAGEQALAGGGVEVVVDRFAISTDRATRIAEALARGFQLGAGTVKATELDGGGEAATFSTRFACRGCGREYTVPTPHLFSFNSPLGACPRCEGFGRVVDIDYDKVVPNKRCSLRDGAVVPWSTPAYVDFQQDFLKSAERRGISTQVPFSQLTDAEKKWIFEGDRENPGVKGFFQWLEERRYKTHVRILLARYRSYRTCPECRGARLKPEALAVRVQGRSIAELSALAIEKLARFMARLELSETAAARTESVLRELRARLGYLEEVGLGYLTLDRQARTLSGGEAQRIHLAAALGSALTDTLYALDEPTVGLHPRDGRRLLKVLRHLTKIGNTVALVEHDPTLIEGADHVIDLGPAGGAGGGQVMYEGKPSGLPGRESATGRLLLIRTLHRQKKRATKSIDRGALVIRGARENNLKVDRIEIPLGRLVCVTGVSGSGKSTLVEQVLYENWLREKGLGGHDAGACDGIDGLERLDDVMMMSQAAIGRSLRSNPATYLKIYDDIRKLFAQTSAARRAKITPGAFSFNTPGGRCEHCQGTGTTTLEMHFMADIEVPCDECEGRRFKPGILEIRYHDRNINEVLAMTVDEAGAFFADRAPIASKLACLQSVGLGYLALGQSTSTLSGGEAQRLKLAGFLAEEKRGKGSLFIFDEPTTGLHLQDVHTLIGVLDGLVARGHSVLVVEHHTDFISHADWVIDLGPEGGDKGGRLVVAGPPLEVARCPKSHTGAELKQLLAM
ncbi:MAG TPA: excinuclease ABC subunit UvrA [Candidatus Limnocylindrales bacterium]|nr:excinuclease ABC subunit UvrA [Candidatus Limnocylindrales bacterium]